MAAEIKEFSFLAEFDVAGDIKDYKLSFSSVKKVANQDSLGRDLDDSFGYEAEPRVYLCINTFEDRSLKLYFRYEEPNGYIVYVRSPVYVDDPAIIHNKSIYLGVAKATVLTETNYVYWTVNSTRSTYFQIVDATNTAFTIDQLPDKAMISLWQAQSRNFLRAGEKGEAGEHWWRCIGDRGPVVNFRLNVLERYNQDGSVKS